MKEWGGRVGFLWVPGAWTEVKGRQVGRNDAAPGTPSLGGRVRAPL